ncbi:MAG: DUF5009 domain-containing protein [Bacteroidales bacterium]|nr:DUF5009 domain-containing protein [Bacteroidales bacterium]
MNKRIYSVDLLRGIAVVGMVFSAAIGYASGLPGWMFHCQVPPPDYIFNPDARGITWVDMVFPMFIFALGVAIPLSMRSKLRKGVDPMALFGMTLQRWAILLAFAVTLGNATLKPIIWLCLFAALVRTDKKWINPAGWGAVAVVLAIQHFFLNIPFSLEKYDIIIVLLARVALVGGIIWLLTRDKPFIRILIWLAIIGLKLYGFDWTQYLIIALPATYVGDMMMEGVNIVKNSDTPRAAIASILGLAAVVIQLIFLYNRQVILDGIITAALGVLCFFVYGSRYITMSFIMLMTGIIFDQIEGGIAKDYCNFSYLILTYGQSLLILNFLIWLESNIKFRGMLVMTGQNPMIAYTVAWYVICPFLSLIGVMDVMGRLAEGSIVFGLLQGLIITQLTIFATALFTKLNLFWKS